MPGDSGVHSHKCLACSEASGCEVGAVSDLVPGPAEALFISLLNLGIIFGAVSAVFQCVLPLISSYASWCFCAFIVFIVSPLQFLPGGRGKDS